ncbi:MAG: hypothetical protein E6H09_01745 [Bacteroidetes bacterium]|jgi:hypothetical protein|nr:MAG: hypothetical protein E6H09_01745 [Bacteroidota bacterium]
MNRVAFIACFISLFSLIGPSCAQTKDQKIAAIRQEFRKINSDSTMTPFTLDDPEDFLGHATDGGAELTGSFKNDKLIKIAFSVGVSYGEKNREYYFRNGKLIFVFETEKDFPPDSLGNIGKLSLAFEGRYYFDNDKLIHNIKKGKRLIQEDTSPQELLDEAAEFSKILKARRK